MQSWPRLDRSRASKLPSLSPEIVSNLLHVCKSSSMKILSLTCRALHKTIAPYIKRRSTDRSVHRIGRARLRTLPSEMVSDIICFCDLSSVKNLSLTCKFLHETVALFVKYRRIDISAHHVGRVGYDPLEWSTYYWSGQCPPRFEVKGLALKQHGLLKETLDRPYLGTRIKNFTWNIRSYCDPDGDWPGRMMKDAVYPDTRMWEAFRSMSNVTKLDLKYDLLDTVDGFKLSHKVGWNMKCSSRFPGWVKRGIMLHHTTMR